MTSSFIDLHTDIQSYIASDFSVKDLKSFSEVSRESRLAVSDALKICFQQLKDHHLFSESKAPHFFKYDPKDKPDEYMRTLLSKVDRLCAMYLLSDVTLRSAVFTCSKIKEYQDRALFQFMNAIAIQTLINVNFTYSNADELRDFLFAHQKEIGAISTNLRITNLIIEILPPEIRYLKGIKSITITDCDLQYVPEEIGEMNALRDMILKNNNLTELPKSIETHKNLKFINLDENNFEEPPIHLPDDTLCTFDDNPCLEKLEAMEHWQKVEDRTEYCYRFKKPQPFIRKCVAWVAEEYFTMFRE